MEDYYKDNGYYCKSDIELLHAGLISIKEDMIQQKETLEKMSKLNFQDKFVENIERTSV